MQLRTFLEAYPGGAAAFAEAIGTSVQAVYRYANGQRLPRRSIMARIELVTKRRVTAADLYRDPDAVAVANDDARRRGEAATQAPVRHPKLPEAA